MVMKWVTMTKEQKQIAGFGIFCGCAVLYGAYFLGMAPALAKTTLARTEFEDAEMERGRMTRAIKAELVNRNALEEKTKRIKNAGQESLPDANDPLSWASELLGRVSRQVGVSLSRVESGGVGQEIIDEVNFSTYGVSVVMTCSYFDAIEFIKVLRGENPYSTVSTFTVRDGASDELHSMQMVIQWPVWKSRELEMKLDS